MGSLYKLLKLLKYRPLANRFAQVWQEIIWVIVGQILTFIGGFAGIKILTNVMGPEGYGKLALGMTIAGMMNMFVFGPIGQVILRFFSIYRERNELGSYFYLLKKAHKTSSVAMIIIAVLIGLIINQWVGREWALLLIMAMLFGIASGINGSFLSLQSAVRQRKVVALHQGIDACLRPVLAVVALYLFNNSGYSALIGYLFGMLIITTSQGIFALRNDEIRLHWHGKKLDKNKERDNISEFFSYGFSMTIFAGFAAVSMYSDRWILQSLLGEREVGIYVATYQIANAPIALLVGMINQFAVPVIFDRAGAMTSAEQAENSARLLRQAIALSSVVMFAVVIAAIIWGELIVKVLTTSAFAEYYKILWVVTLGIALFNIGQMLSLKGFYYNRTNVYLLPKAIQAVSFVISAFFLTKLYGVLGMALTLAFSSLLYLLAVYLVNTKICEYKNT